MKTSTHTALALGAYVALLGGTVGYALYEKSKPTPERVVNICVLNSTELPEREKLINAAMHTAAVDYKREANIRLNVVKQGVYANNLSDLIFDRPARNPRSLCSDADIALVFTTANNILACAKEDDTTCPVSEGFANEEHGYVIKLGNDRGNSEEYALTLEHEIGHLLRLDHSADTLSFMHGTVKPNRRWQSPEREYLLSKKTNEDLLPYAKRPVPDSVHTKQSNK